jgi:DNA-binding FrmR family transcriptional regulator
MKHSSLHKTHPDIVKRLKRIEGHLRAIVDMIEGERSCLDIAQQMHAVEKAIGAAKRELIHDHIDHCLELTAEGDPASAGRAISEFKEISKYL